MHPQKTEDILSNLIYCGIYRNDGFVILKGIKTNGEINNWLKLFQSKVDEIAESKCLQFTAEA